MDTLLYLQSISKLASNFKISVQFQFDRLFRVLHLLLLVVLLVFNFYLFFLKGMGLVSIAFPPEALQKLRHGALGISHTRYSTTGVSELQNCQPFVVDTMHGKVAVAHNGELINAHALRKKVSRAAALMCRVMCGTSSM